MSDLSKMSVDEIVLEVRRTEQGMAGLRKIDRMVDELARRLREAEQRAEAAEAVVAKLPWDSVRQIPAHWCSDCFNYALRAVRKNDRCCSGCEYGRPDDDPTVSLDDDNAAAIEAVVRWAQSALAARAADDRSTGEVGDVR